MEAAGFQQEDVGEDGDDFFDVMSDENEGWRTGAGTEALDELEEVFAGNAIEAGAGLVEDEEARTSHEGATNEDALALTLGEDAPWAGGEVDALDLAKDAPGLGAVARSGFAPEIDHCEFATDNGVEGGLVIVHHLADGRGDDADGAAEFAPIGGAVTLAEDLDFACGGSQVAGKGGKEGGLAGAVRPENDPVLAFADGPGETVEDLCVVAGDGEAGDAEDEGIDD